LVFFLYIVDSCSWTLRYQWHHPAIGKASTECHVEHGSWEKW